jgi:hypothetical protein
MSTQVFNIELEAESDLTLTFVYNDSITGLPVDLTGYKAEMQVRQKYDGYDNQNISLEFNTNVNGGITLGGTAGTVTLAIPSSATSQYTWTDGVYDLFLVSNTGVRTKFLKGFFTIIQNVTRSEQSSL